MRAYQVVEFGPPSALRISEIKAPSPGEHEILVDVAAAGVNFPDTLVVSGRYQFLPERPFVPGKEIAGVVRAVGAGVSGFARGDRVLAQLEHGAYAEQALVRPEDTFHLPAGLGFAEATAMGLVYQTAYFALRDRAGLHPGETVLVGGAAGGVGVAGIQLAKAFGARVLAAVPAAPTLSSMSVVRTCAKNCGNRSLPRRVVPASTSCSIQSAASSLALRCAHSRGAGGSL